MRLHKNDFAKFRADLTLTSWENIGKQNNANIAWEMWNELFLAVSNYQAPLKYKGIRNKPAPWLTSNLTKLMFERDKLKK